MTILDELERLSKDATPVEWMPCGDILRNEAVIRTKSEYLFCSYGPMTMRDADNARLIVLMRNNIDALIQVARAAQHINWTCSQKRMENLHKALEKLEAEK